MLETGIRRAVRLRDLPYSRERNIQKGQQSTDSERPTAGREMYRKASRVQIVRGLKQAEKRTEGPADKRQPETYSRQGNVQKDQQSTESQ